MRLYIQGHAPRLGYAVSRTWSVAECRAFARGTVASNPEHDKPARFIQERERAFRFVDRWNRLFATH